MPTIFSKRLVRLAAVLLLLVGGFYFGSGAYLVRARPAVIEGLPDLANADLIHVPSASGTVLQGWKLDPDQMIGVALLFHEEGADRRSMLSRAKFLVAAGYTVIFFDFRAHGASWGEKVSFGDRERYDVEAVVRYARTRYSRRPLVAIGRSMGAAAMLLAESPLGVDAMVLEAPYSDLRQAMTNSLRGWKSVFSPLLRWQLGWQLDLDFDETRPLDRIAKVGGAVLIMGGQDDVLTPPSDLRELFEAAAKPRQLEMIDGAGHEDLHAVDPARYEALVLEFFAAHATR